MNIEVNWLAVILATASSMVVGAIWYARPVFGDIWARMIKLNPKDMGKGSAIAILTTIIVSFITAAVLAHVVYIINHFFQSSFLQDSVVTALWLWAGFTAARFITHDAFERRPVGLTLMNITHELITLLVMALIIGLLQP